MNDQPTPKLRNAQLPHSGYLVLRGVTRQELAREAAIRFQDRYPGWHTYGVSAFYASGSDDVNALCGDQMRTWQQIAVFKIEDLRDAGLSLYPTFRTPHVTIACQDLDQLIYLLDHTIHRIIENPYYVIRK